MTIKSSFPLCDACAARLKVDDQPHLHSVRFALEALRPCPDCFRLFEEWLSSQTLLLRRAVWRER
jgi:hypothetical protein